tara:strand:+ start:4399 stop:4950 length:552 start_codon:yes stop_codon:yes gene_type:complete
MNEKYSRSKIFIFDLDDTLIISKAKIIVTDKNNGDTFSLTPEEFNSYERNDKHVLNFDEFRDIEILKGGKIIEKYINILEKNYKKGNAIGIITARDDKQMIFNFFKEHVGFHIDNELIWAINDPKSGLTGNIAERKRQAFEWFIDKGYVNLTFYDDDNENINIIKKLSKEHKQLKIKAVKATY